MEHLTFRCLQCEEAKEARDRLLYTKQLLWDFQAEELKEHGRLQDKWIDAVVFPECRTARPGLIGGICDRDPIVKIMRNLGYTWADLLPQLDWNELYERDRQLAASENLINEKDNSKIREVTTQ